MKGQAKNHSDNTRELVDEQKKQTKAIASILQLEVTENDSLEALHKKADELIARSRARESNEQ